MALRENLWYTHLTHSETKEVFEYDIQRNRRAAAKTSPGPHQYDRRARFYISSGGEVLSSFRQSVALMSQEDKESYLAIFRRVLSGTQDKT